MNVYSEITAIRERVRNLERIEQPAKSGGLPVYPTLTQGSVLFAGAGGVIAQDNSNLYWDDTNNYLGIGTTSPSYNLSVAWSANSSSQAVQLRNTNVGSSAYTPLYIGNDTDAAGAGILRTSAANTGYGGANSLNIWTVGASPIGIVTNNALRMSIDVNGYLRISPNTVNIAMFHSNGLYLGGHVVPSKTLEIATDSAGKPTTNTWQIISDERTKRNVEPYTTGLDLIRQINPVSFEYNGLAYTPEGDTGVGVIAQEIEKFAPQMIHKYKRKLREDDAEETEILEYQGNEVQYALINAVKELEQRLIVLERK